MGVLCDLVLKIAEGCYNFAGWNFPDDPRVNDCLAGLRPDKKLNFSGATFAGEVSFKFKVFEKEVNFENVTFQGDVSFSQTVFWGAVKFSGARFEGRGISDFSAAELRSIAYFEGVRFYSSITFANAKFSQNARFKEAQFYRDAVFTGEHLFADGADFSNARFSGSRAEFNTDMSQVSLIGTILHNVDFTQSTWGRKKERLRYERSICIDELNATRNDDYQKAAEAAMVCCNVKQCYQRTGNYDEAGCFYYGEMELKRKLARGRKRCLIDLLRRTCGYGERPSLVLLNAFLVIFLWAVIFSFTGISTHGVEEKLALQLDLSETLDTGIHLLRCLYFSAITFTTLGYGDYHPSSTSSQLAAAAEAFLGILMTALFIFTFGRKMMR